MNSTISEGLIAATIAVLITGISCQERPAPQSAAVEPPPGNGEMLFRVQVSDTGLQSHWLAEGNELTDFVEVRLPGKLYDPPLRFDVIQDSDANRGTPIEAAVSDFSAFKADDDEWILANFIPEEREAILSLLNNPVARERNKNAFEGRDYLYVTGEAEYQEYALVFTRDAEDLPVRPLVFKKGSDRSNWLRTNELSADTVYDIVFSALGTGGEVRVLE